MQLLIHASDTDAMRCVNIQHMEWERVLDCDKISEKGFVIGTIGHLTLILRSDKTYYIIDDNGSHLDHLTNTDIDTLKQIVELFNEWSAVHKLKPDPE